MGAVNHIRTLGYYSKTSHEGYTNTIELPVGNSVVPLRSDTIRLLQNRCSFYGLWSEDPNQHLKDFLKLVDSLDLDGENRERTSMRLFQFSLHDQASNWLERLPAGSITTWVDLTTRFLAQFFLPGRTEKLHNDILMFQQHKGESLSEAWTRFKDLLQKFPHHGIDLWLQDLALYDNESWNDPRDFANPVKAISLTQDVPSTSDRRLIELETHVQRLMEAHLSTMQPTQVNKITSSCEICSGPHDTQCCIKNPKQAFVEYASSRIDEARGALLSDTVKNPKLNVNSTTSVLSARSYPTEDPKCSTHIHGSINTITIHPKQQSNSHDDKPEENRGEEKNRDDGDVMFIEIVKKNDDSRKEEPEAGGLEIMRRKLDLKENSDRGISNFTGRIKGMHVFVGNFTYVTDFMIVEDISSIIDPRLTDEVFYKIPHKIEQYNSLSDLEKEHTKSVYLRNEEDKRRRVEYVMSKILGFYKECLELGPEYVTGMDDEGEVT
ncbi:MAK10-like protein [Tanacetum coccineum]